ncbi:MAG: tetratricopeptide repeat protein [Muribaculaceae bacterium]|nr:tetratricopeptide repeat protein [Muribaculaceae bacterium]
MENDFRKKLEELHKDDHHQEIVSILEKIPAEQRDFETIGLLARAYNNIDLYVKAIELLESVKEEGEGDALWNYRLGYAHYYLDNLPEALSYFNTAKELDSSDEDTKYFIRCCNKEMPLSKRVENFWAWFVENEEKLSEMIHPRTQEEAEKFTEFVHEGTSLISENIYFNLGGDHEFTFSVEGWQDLFIIYPYIISRMPESLKSKWKFFPFSQGKDGPFGFRMYGADIDTKQILVRASYREDIRRFHLSYYDKTLSGLPERESNNAFWVILENTLGEGVSYKYIDDVEEVKEIEDGMIPLPELSKYIEETVKSYGHGFVENPKDIYTAYRLQPQENDELRFDVITGSTCLDSLVSEYYRDSTEMFDHINSFGAGAIFIAFPNGDEENEIVSLRHEIEDRITDEILEPMNLGQVIGGATGTDNSYIDLLVYDAYAFLENVIPLLKEYPSFSFYVSDFRRRAELMRLTEAETE